MHETHTLSDGAKLRADYFNSPIAPSFTTLTIRPAGSTNWSAPQVFSGSGALSSLAGSVAVVVPWGNTGGNNSTTTVIRDDPPAPMRPPPTRPPGHTPKDSGNRGH